ncbi:hypothetical protein SAMN04488502_1097 [Dendrosporobacter quercicolus]|uniref:Uncharacterized protein n=1 Tax=Dendrosporobacter quercicolus TaxID=146817 RepID=A0A1G9X6Z4_9FIRM|nr:hypothetical protein SAMN04488502_1097 [Dendrosporobacter quercicolus]
MLKKMYSTELKLEIVQNIYKDNSFLNEYKQLTAMVQFFRVGFQKT